MGAFGCFSGLFGRKHQGLGDAERGRHRRRHRGRDQGAPRVHGQNAYGRGGNIQCEDGCPDCFTMGLPRRYRPLGIRSWMSGMSSGGSRSSGRTQAGSTAYTDRTDFGTNSSRYGYSQGQANGYGYYYGYPQMPGFNARGYGSMPGVRPYPRGYHDYYPSQYGRGPRQYDYPDYYRSSYGRGPSRNDQYMAALQEQYLNGGRYRAGDPWYEY